MHSYLSSGIVYLQFNVSMEISVIASLFSGHGVLYSVHIIKISETKLLKGLITFGH